MRVAPIDSSWSNAIGIGPKANGGPRARGGPTPPPRKGGSSLRHRRPVRLLAAPPRLRHGHSSQAPPAQNPPADPPAAQVPAEPPAAQAPEPTVDETASPELVGQVVNELGVTPKQAQAAAGTVFGLSKTKLSAADFGKIASVVPGMDGQQKPAPTDGKQSPREVIAGQSGGEHEPADIHGSA